MPHILEKVEFNSFTHEGRGTFCLADDGFIYHIRGCTNSYVISQLQRIREGLTFSETVIWEQFVYTNQETPHGPRGGHLPFRSMKKALQTIEEGELQLVPLDDYRDWRVKRYTERSAEDYLPSRFQWAISKGRDEEWACRYAQIPSVQQPWKARDCPPIPLRTFR
jgi:hypothetical protein